MKRPPVLVLSELIEKFSNSDFDKVKAVFDRLDGLDEIIELKAELESAITAVEALAPITQGELSGFVAAPLLDNAVDFSEEGYEEQTTLGTFLATLGISYNLSTEAIAAFQVLLDNLSVADGVAFSALIGRFPETVENVEQALGNLSTRFGSVLLVNDSEAEQAYVSGDLVLANDLSGEDTSYTLSSAGVTEVFDSSNNRLKYDELAIGSEVTVQVELEVTTTEANQEATIKLTLAEGSPSAKVIPMYNNVIKSVGTKTIVSEITFIIRNADIRDGISRLKFNSDANATVAIKQIEVFTRAYR